MLLHLFSKFLSQCSLYSLIFIENFALIYAVDGVMAVDLRPVFVIQNVVHGDALLADDILADGFLYLTFEF